MGIAVSNINVGHPEGGRFYYYPNSVGSVGLLFDIQNTSSKIIKYAYFYFVPYNAVNDVVGSTIDEEAEKCASFTGPLEPNQLHQCVFEDVWYNSTIKRAVLTKVKIQYIDGTEETVLGSEVTSVSYVSNNSSTSSNSSSSKESAIESFSQTIPGIIIFFIILPLVGIILLGLLLSWLWSCAS